MERAEIMNKMTLEGYKSHLESFLKDYGEFKSSGYYSKTEQLRTRLQRAIPLVSQIVDAVHGGHSLNIESKTITFRQALAYSLTGNIPDEHQKFLESNIELTLNEAIGNIVNGTIPTREIQPVLPIMNEDLRKRCMDLLNAPGSFDRVIREATVVLEHRLRAKISHERLSEVIPSSAEQIGESLANKLLSPSNPVIVVSEDKLERVAFLKMIQGVFAYLRNSSHHSLDDKTKWSLAWSVVGLIDSLLIELDHSYVSGEKNSDSHKRTKK